MKRGREKLKLKVKIHSAGFGMFVLALLFGESTKIIASLIALFIHEVAHLAVMLLLGVRECMIELTPFGGMADSKHYEECSPSKRFVIAAAGVGVSALLWWVCRLQISHSVRNDAFGMANASLVIMNLLPAWPLDGARMLEALLSAIGFGKYAKRIMTDVTYLVAFSLMFVGLYGCWYGVVNWTLLCIGPYLCYAARSERITGKVRKLSSLKNQLKKNPIAEADIYVCTPTSLSANGGALLGKLNDHSYGLFAEVDPQNGKIIRWWSQQEVERNTFKLEVNGGAKT